MSNKARILIIGLMSSLLFASPSLAGVWVNEDVSFFEIRPVECAGDEIYLFGTIHLIITETFDRSGGRHWRIQLQVKDVTGFGIYSGNTYRATGLIAQQVQQELTAPPYGTLPFILPFVRSLNLIGERGDIIEIHDIVHITVDPNANLRVERFDYNTSCR